MTTKKAPVRKGRPRDTKKPSVLSSEPKRQRRDKSNQSKLDKDSLKSLEDSWDGPKSFIVYHDSKEAIPFESLDDAETFYKKMLLRQRKSCDVLTYDTFEDFHDAELVVLDDSSDEESDTESSKKTTPTETSPAPITPDKLAQRIKQCLNQGSNTSNGSKFVKKATPNLKLLHARIKKNLNSAGCLVKVHFWPQTPEFCQGKVVFLEFLDSLNMRNHWLHKPTAYENMVTADAVSEPEDYIFPPALHELGTAVRRAEPCVKGSADEFTVKELEKGRTYKIMAEGMYYVVPHDVTEDTVAMEVSQLWIPVTANESVRELYAMCVKEMVMSPSVHRDLDNIQGSLYWKQFGASLSPENITVVTHGTLDELFNDNKLPHVAAKLCNVSINRAFEEKYSQNYLENQEMKGFVSMEAL